ncbi:MAG: Spy/CpxP family protein refolding chaperone [Amphritea sp.]
MRKQLIIGLTAAVIGAGALGVNVAQADREGDHERCGKERGGKYGHMFSRHEMKAEHRMEKLTEQLNLSEEQQDQVEQLFDQQRDQMRTKMKGFFEMRKDMHNLNVAATDYDQQVEAMITQAQDKAATMIRMRAEQKKSLYAILTPEQQEQFLNLHK